MTSRRNAERGHWKWRLARVEQKRARHLYAVEDAESATREEESLVRQLQYVILFGTDATSFSIKY